VRFEEETNGVDWYRIVYTTLLRMVERLTGGSRFIPVGPVFILGSTQFDLSAQQEHPNISVVDCPHCEPIGSQVAG
jgi:hypothetical protein